MKKLLQFTSTIRKEKEELVSTSIPSYSHGHSTTTGTHSSTDEPAKPSLLPDTYHGQILDKYNYDDDVDDDSKAWHTGIYMYLYYLLFISMPHYNLIY